MQSPFLAPGGLGLPGCLFLYRQPPYSPLFVAVIPAQRLWVIPSKHACPFQSISPLALFALLERPVGFSEKAVHRPSTPLPLLLRLPLGYPLASRACVSLGFPSGDFHFLPLCPPSVRPSCYSLSFHQLLLVGELPADGGATHIVICRPLC